ncbi:MAG: hypothetical protein R3176_02950 [Woeseiaceae bacterium]|nr:hypothetical protein [Woeseiaceae bacterium]
MPTGRFPCLAPLLAAALLAWHAPLAAAILDSDCHALKLVAAGGVPGSGTHTYVFSGTCNVVLNLSSGPAVQKTVPAEAEATWDPAKKEFSEAFRVLAEFSGYVSGENDGKSFKAPWEILPLPVESRFACNDDPLISNAHCGLLAHQNRSGFYAFSNPAIKQSRPLLKGKTNLEEATKLASLQKNVLGVTATLPAAPQDQPPTMSRLGAPVLFEAEDLIGKGAARTSGGMLAVQPMQQFGAGWGNNAQAFWSGGTAGAVLDLVVNVPVAGKYRVELFMTRAPDYGDLLLQVEGNIASNSFSGFADKVVRSDAINVGTFDLPAGPRRISLKLLGKHVKSSGHLVGVDQVRLVPVTQ